jgi:TetR/AcrR family tetracycline transcriptional repressor
MPAPSKITSNAILDSAFALLVDEGVEAVTLRRLAARLGVEAPSLYRHVGSKAELLAMVAVRLFKRDVDAIGAPACWQDWVVAFGERIWVTQAAIPGSAGLFLSSRLPPDQQEAMVQWVAEVLGRYGVDPDLAAEIQFSVLALVIGLGSYASGPNSDFFEGRIGLRRVLEDSLDALVRGWEARMAAAG